MKTMTYRGYTAEIIYSEEDECFVGDVVDIDDIICFHGDTDEELRVAFEGVVDLSYQRHWNNQITHRKRTSRGDCYRAYAKHSICKKGTFVATIGTKPRK